MRSFSNAHFSEVELVQSNRWELGPLELVFVDQRLRNGCYTKRGLELGGAISEWNQSAAAGLARPARALDVLVREFPSMKSCENPNMIFVPRQRAGGLTELHVMLASLLPEMTLRTAGIHRSTALFDLTLLNYPDRPSGYASAIYAAFEQYIWTKLAPQPRLRESFFSATSPLRLLSGDITLWMNRVYRVALEIKESFREIDSSEKKWRPLAEVAAELSDSLPLDLRDRIRVRRPLYGGDLWDVHNAEERELVIEEAITGAGVMDSLEPIIELLHTQRAHEDFSDRYSWVREDFERSFYSKRSKLQVVLIETVDDFPAWSADAHDGYDRVLLRDIFAFLNPRERKLFLALRQGRTVGEIAKREELSGHAAISRRVKALKKKVSALLK
jgi:hypothetical protein